MCLCMHHDCVKCVHTRFLHVHVIIFLLSASAYLMFSLRAKQEVMHDILYLKVERKICLQSILIDNHQCFVLCDDIPAVLQYGW